MDYGLTGKSVLVTGSSKGIGKAIAESFHEHGARVALNARNATQLKATTNKLDGSIGIVGDLTCPVQANKVVTDLLSSFGELDILVCNIGSGRSVLPGRENYEEWQRMFALNLWSTTNIVEAAKDALVKNKGRIICISSICGLEVIAGAPIAYSAAKAALHAYVRGIARPLGKHGVTINAIAPGNILFEGSVWSGKLSDDRPAVERMLKQNVSLGCLGSPSDIANLANYLASPLSAFATGQIWTLDGGQTHG